MKSCLGMFVIFLGTYIILYYDIFSFLLQPFMFKISLIIVGSMLAIVVTSLLILAKKRGDNDENKLLH